MINVNFYVKQICLFNFANPSTLLPDNRQDNIAIEVVEDKEDKVTNG